MSTSRSNCCFRSRTVVCCFIVTLMAGICFLYATHVKSIEFVKSQQTDCLNEQNNLFKRFREESLSKYRVELELKTERKVVSELSKERTTLHNQLDSLQVELEALKLECSKYEKLARDKLNELEKHKSSYMELKSEMFSKDHMIDSLKQERKSHKEMIKKLRGGNKSFPFQYPPPPHRQEAKRLNSQVELQSGEYSVLYNRPSPEAVALNLYKLADVLTSKSSTASIISKNKLDNLRNNGSSNAAIRPMVPNGVAPELLVNDERHKNSDYALKLDVSNEKKNVKSLVDGKPPNRYKSKLDKEESGKFIKLDNNNNINKDAMFHFGEEQKAFDSMNKNHLEDVESNNIVNDANISLDDQAEPEDHQQEEDDYDDLDKADLPHPAENGN